MNLAEPRFVFLLYAQLSFSRPLSKVSSFDRLQMSLIPIQPKPESDEPAGIADQLFDGSRKARLSSSSPLLGLVLLAGDRSGNVARESSPFA